MAQTPIITTPAGLEQLANDLQQLAVFAVDLEADSMHSFREKVCLLQFTYYLADKEHTVLLDPLAVPDLSVLRPVLADPAVRKIFHAADYDIRCLFRDFEIEIHGLFDTMISSQLLGEERVGLADILGKYFDVSLDKKYQRSDWSKRPLSPEMCHYAAEDTRYLHQLVAILEGQLVEKDRLWWAQEEFALLEQARFQVHEGPAFLRMKGAGTLSPRSLAILENLIVWRNGEAARRDCPAYKVLGPKALLSVARHCPDCVADLKKVDDFSPRLVDRYGKAVLLQVEQAMLVAEGDLPCFPRAERRVRDAAVDKRFARLKQWRKGKAVELALDPGILINNALLEEIARQFPTTPDSLQMVTGLKCWQSKVLGSGLLMTLVGGGDDLVD
ncbi:MAG: HRDC domain-containing protein [Thermodesulfobacteriota bacterium]|nr:HRDC domain-containing protein [Thermodesulfobacteriota bacterium]